MLRTRPCPLFGATALVASLVAATACSDVEPDPSSAEWSLALLTTLGSPGLEGEPGPDVIGSAIAAAPSTRGTFVLDQQASRVVWFGNDARSLGSFGREGDGPGEFRLARHVAMRGDSVVSVLDYQTGRVTTFGIPSLELRDVFSGIPGGGFHHAWVGDTVWIIRPNRDGPSHPLATGYLASSGVEVESAPVAGSEDQPFGGAFGISSSGRRIVTSTRRPGIWWERVHGSWRRVGAPLFPEAPPEKRVEVEPRLFRVIPSPASASEIALLGDSLVVQRYVLQPGVQEAEDPSSVPREVHLGIFRIDGTPLGSVPVDVGTGCLASDDGSVLLLCSWEPYPQVRRYRLIPPSD